ncbi:MAG: 3-phosphoshikimate 1-carboxyvinyltransferase [Halanaerobium sp. 4-GBenrich]|uniref:3-phosphoshikimate 1-carboxyvinyltransferase n=1 Tax=Halanaerobium congolense TaxID=54121 RepID=A0A1G6IZ21_9FIRM|nr:3-phosphoshikimate 1-carboxyvinyltransferase [Halanaerobium congolense]ODS50463.1 MAG: 3-phosphoshikimate 1-carboxyvinyltransferase [Halanaerobium sp. 4-GBenrich]PUU91718.1 MAG: 3-phosphoshikimate 1-carboxyvinyltransferase [Halanaerobium sp.]TDS33939.1 3-phosphoshikimate 1-carboxyvinyltransferase [Halanaerobium congolense]SDC11758.1 3-phosphoshikimate 1-carboxyvinyltransferase [Halanaerobium congolense]SDI44629.1 3-phosphoshikimate 1-carboxyvinyltransferase [Halanaerobium congolense]
MSYQVNPALKINGKIKVPGDKSISHRSLILASIAEGESKIEGLLEAEDCLSTMGIMRDLGIKITKENTGNYTVQGRGLAGLQEADNVLDCGNSGTSMRLLAGLLSSQDFYSVLTGDHSLRKRPMQRIIGPLSNMGAEIWSRKDGLAPLSIKGQKLQSMNYELPVASAQLKSSILLAALKTESETVIVEPAVSRDHTERMLKGAGVDLEIKKDRIILKEAAERKLSPFNIKVPGDISSAAFFIAAGLLADSGSLLIKNVGINQTRSGFLEIVEAMNGKIELLNQKDEGGEPTADILVKASKLKGCEVSGEIIPRLIDEIPIISVMAVMAEGKTIIKDAEELRVKETDRIAAVVKEFKRLGIEIIENPDGMEITGVQKVKGGIEVESYHDHRIAMSLAVLALNTEKGITINGSEIISTSFPNFKELLAEVRG